MSGLPPLRETAAAWLETATIAAVSALLAFRAGQIDARLVGALLDTAAVLCAVEAMHVHHGARAHLLAGPAVAALVAAAAAVAVTYVLTTG